MIKRPTRAAALAALLAVPLLTGCSVNFGAVTDQPYTPARGVSERSGNVAVLNALVVAEREGSGTVVATLVNSTTEEDELTEVTIDDTPAFLAEGADLAIPAGGMVNLAEEGAVYVASDAVVEGTFVDLRFTFAGGDTVTVEAPVVPNSGEYEDVPFNAPAANTAG